VVFAPGVMLTGFSASEVAPSLVPRPHLGRCSLWASCSRPAIRSRGRALSWSESRGRLVSTSRRAVRGIGKNGL